MTDNSVVIYGSGIAGTVLAHRLSSDFNVTLVSPVDYFEIPMAMPRALVEPGLAEHSVIPLKDILPNVTKVQGHLSALTGDGGLVQTAHGEQLISGTVSVLATGSRYATQLVRANGGTYSGRRHDYEAANRRLEKAQRILVVGAGAVGMEIAGEITQDYPRKQVTVLDGSESILRGISVKAANKAVEKLTARGVNFVLGERLVQPSKPSGEYIEPAGEAKTNTGRSISYDALIWCVGGKPNTDYMVGKFSHLLDAKGQICVAPDLRVKGQDDLYALGDIAALSEVNKAVYIQGHVSTVENNIRSTLLKQAKKLKSYSAKEDDTLMLLTLGRKEGVLSAPLIGAVSWSWLVQKAKSRDMLVGMYRNKVDAPAVDVADLSGFGEEV